MALSHNSLGQRPRNLVFSAGVWNFMTLERLPQATHEPAPSALDASPASTQQPNQSRVCSRLIFPQPIAETAHGFNCVAGFTEFFAQTAHVRVHGASVDHAFVAPDVVEQFIALLHPASALD